VKLVQFHLNFIRWKYPSLGDAYLEYTSEYDKLTETMVRSFQKKPASIGVDGVVGPGTGRALNYYTQLIVNAEPHTIEFAPQAIPVSHLKKNYSKEHEYRMFRSLPFDDPASAPAYPTSPLAEITADRNQNTPWMTVAYGEYGTKEISGKGHNARILRYSGALTGDFKSDETPWCSAFANWVMMQVGIAGTRSGWAKSWRNWGRSLGKDNPRYGAIAVFNRKYWSEDDQKFKNGSHVGFYVAHKGGRIELLGGNQGDSVSISPYPKASEKYQLLDYRWPPNLI